MMCIWNVSICCHRHANAVLDEARAASIVDSQMSLDDSIDCAREDELLEDLTAQMKSLDTAFKVSCI